MRKTFISKKSLFARESLVMALLSVGIITSCSDDNNSNTTTSQDNNGGTSGISITKYLYGIE